MEEVMNKQNEIYKFLKNYTENKGYPPSVREICEAVSLSSTSTVHGHLRRLEKKGMIKRDPSKPRALEIAEISIIPKEMISIPIIGKITDGIPLLAAENIEDTFQLPLDYIKHDRELFMVRVSDNSMINIGIAKSDLAIIEEVNDAKNGDIILTLIYNSISIKRYFKEKDHIRLQPENDTMDSILIDKCKILGKLVGIFRSFE
ncbi:MULTISPECIES: transcriptional repressor LexA [unclassified Clostridium]|uniref:transcriptional repressor LexA n=1 Tax=unclassified Clostridium TaxID=2614128 RepID=UPI000297C10F|nr:MULTISPECIES: transcriptional repressor LexA [unclassified Clostridium]EKQ51371.1 MAG: SOS regulatory protein LexA [Clostridium sp. Maddingley MBC34-26]